MGMRGLALVMVAGVMGSGAAMAADLVSQVEYGRYLVESVGLCDDCHTPRDAVGQLDGGRRLQGSAIGFQPSGPVPAWADSAPPIAGGRPGWTRAQMVEFLATGIGPGGHQARPPMPPYRLKRQDAEAVAAYLESLPGPASTSPVKATTR